MFCTTPSTEKPTCLAGTVPVGTNPVGDAGTILYWRLFNDNFQPLTISDDFLLFPVDFLPLPNHRRKAFADVPRPRRFRRLLHSWGCRYFGERHRHH